MATEGQVTLASVLGARQPTSEGAASSRSLLMTVMGEFVLPHGGVAWTQTLVALMEQLGVREKATRQALARMEDRGWLQRERLGRQTRWILTNQATELLQSGADRIYSFGQSKPAWDEHWVVLLTSVPESERQIRYRMGVGLNWAGFGSLGQGVWISPWRRQEAAATTLLGDLAIQATSFVAQIGQLGSGESLANEGWDLPELQASYDEFLNETAALVDRPHVEGIDAVAALTNLVHRWRRFPFLDPDLPASVLPPGWPGPEAAGRFAMLRSSLSLHSAEWWLSSEQRPI